MPNILIIEDEDIIALDISHKLSKKGFDSTILIELDQILEYVSSNKVDLILADIDLPGEYDGIEIVAELQKKFDIPAFFLTAYDEDEIMERAQLTAPFAYLLKPFDEKELLMTVNIALYRHNVEQEMLYKEKWITSIIDNISDGVIVTDINGNITFANKMAQEVIGMKELPSSDSLHYTNYFTLLDDERRDFTDDIVMRSISATGPTWLPGISFVHNGHLLCSCDCNLSPFLDHRNIVSGAIITFKKKPAFVY